MHTRLLPTFLLVTALATAACAGTPVAGQPATGDPTTGTTQPGSPGPAETTAPDAPQPTAPSASDTPPEAVDCSTQGVPTDSVSVGDLPQPVREAAGFLLDAAVRCDEQLLATAADESGTTLSFGEVSPHEAFALPDGDERYRALVTLLTELPSTTEAIDGTTIHVWPRVHTGAFVDDDTAWQEVADAGLHDPDELARMRDAGSGYLGWRLGIDEHGSWRFLVAGD